MNMQKYMYLAILYVVWGSTYLAMRIGVQPGSGFPVFAFGATRCLLAAVILLGLALLRRQSIRPQAREWLVLCLTGTGMWVTGHGLVLWAEQYVASGVAAIALATGPLWTMLAEAMLDKTLPKARTWFFVSLGFLGVSALVVPEFGHATSAPNALGLLLLIVAPISWAYCGVYLSRNPMRLPTLTVSAYQHLFGSLGFAALSWLGHEPRPMPTTAAYGALAFLVVFGSVIAYTVYIQALKIMPVSLVMTNTYVNPMIAVFLGWMILREPISLWTGVAAALVILSVAETLRKGHKA